MDSEVKVFRALALTNGVCENLVCALKAFDESADGKRQHCGYALRGSAGAEQIEDH